MFHAEEVQANVRDLLTLALDRVDTVPLLPDILHLATEHDISDHDAIYVMAAQSLGILLLTADERLAGKGDAEGRINILLLTDL